MSLYEECSMYDLCRLYCNGEARVKKLKPFLSFRFALGVLNYAPVFDAPIRHCLQENEFRYIYMHMAEFNFSKEWTVHAV